MLKGDAKHLLSRLVRGDVDLLVLETLFITDCVYQSQGETLSWLVKELEDVEGEKIF